MPDGGFHETRPISPLGLGAVVAMHAAVLGALALAKMDIPPIETFKPIKAIFIPVAPVPPARPAETPRATQPQSVTLPRPVERVPLPDSTAFDVADVPMADRTADDGPVVRADPLPELPVDPPVATPVKIAATLAAGAILQPPYPAAAERAGEEGVVTIRITIGTDGRVSAAEPIAATDPAFYRATERHALRHWRFRPATIDGRPVESRQVMRVVFQLPG